MYEFKHEVLVINEMIKGKRQKVKSGVLFTFYLLSVIFIILVVEVFAFTEGGASPLMAPW